MTPPFSHPAFRGRFGVCRREISPPPGIYSRNWGAAESDVATGLHRPMTLTALTLCGEDGGGPLAIVALDLGWWRAGEEESVLDQAVREAGIAEGRFMLALSHTHAGPNFCPAESHKPGGEHIAGYLRFLAAEVRDAVRQALASAVPGILETASGHCGLAANRDLPDPQGHRLLVGWNPEIPADDTLLIGRISGMDGRCLATVVNYACHPTILAWQNTAISPDFLGTMRETIESGTSAPCLFLQGASGELAPRHQYTGDTAVADRAGRSLGHAALSVLHGMLEPGHELVFQGAVESGASLAVWDARPRTGIPEGIIVRSVDIRLPLKEGFPEAGDLEKQIANCPDRVLAERLQRRLLSRRALGPGTFVHRRHVLWRVGGIVFLAIPDEIYSAFQVALRESAGSAPVLISTLANSSRGYLAPRHSYDAKSYASEQSPYAAGCFEAVQETLTAELRKLL